MSNEPHTPSPEKPKGFIERKPTGITATNPYSLAGPSNISSVPYGAPSTGFQGPQSYYNYPQWQGPWSMTNNYAEYAAYHANPQFHQFSYPPTSLSLGQQSLPENMQGPNTQDAQMTQSDQSRHQPSRASSPPSETFKHWDKVIASFLEEVGLIQALRGFECDMLVLNDQWERKQVPGALQNLIKRLTELGSEPLRDDEEHTLRKRKLSYTHLPSEQNQTSINKSISQFLAQNRSRNDRSNRAEFLLSLEEKRKKLNSESYSTSEAVPSCARTDAKTIDRDTQMKYDIAKNDDGPLRKTVKDVIKQVDSSVEEQTKQSESPLVRHPALDERIKNIETHFGIRYVPSPPRSLLSRITLLEDHIIKLEKEYPPWAALHFNQPNRGWPPPPRATPTIVPPQLRQVDTDKKDHESKAPATGHTQNQIQGKSSNTKPRNTRSSLHRAVLERLEVQQAMDDLAGNIQEQE